MVVFGFLEISLTSFLYLFQIKMAFTVLEGANKFGCRRWLSKAIFRISKNYLWR